MSSMNVLRAKSWVLPATGLVVSWMLYASLNCLGHRVKPIWAPVVLSASTVPSAASSVRVEWSIAAMAKRWSCSCACLKATALSKARLVAANALVPS
eukprot:7287372-Pyramimonas_sp.AAC.1